MDERFHLEESHLIWTQPLSVAARKSYSDERECEMTPRVQKPQVFYIRLQAQKAEHDDVTSKLDAGRRWLSDFAIFFPLHRRYAFLAVFGPVSSLPLCHLRGVTAFHSQVAKLSINHWRSNALSSSLYPHPKGSFIQYCGRVPSATFGSAAWLSGII
jgi:hypothetical protein